MNHLRVYAIATCLASLSVAGCSGGNAGLNGTPPGRASTGAHRQLPGGTFAEYSITQPHEPRVKAFPIGIIDAGGALWFAERGWGKLATIDAGGDITSYKLKTRGDGPSFHPQTVALGVDGNLWAACGTNRTYRQESGGAFDPYGSIRRMTPAGVVTAVVKLPTKGSDPRSIVSGPDGNLWFAEARGAIGEVLVPKGTGAPKLLHEFPIDGGNRVYTMAVARDGVLWFGETFNNIIGNITTKGKITYIDLPKKATPAGIVADGGYIYFSEFRASKVAQMTPSGTIVGEVSLAAHSYPKGITVGSDGNLYVAEFGTGNIAEIPLTGSTMQNPVEFPIPTPHSGPWFVTSGPDGNIWFTESLRDKIGKLSI